MRSLHYLRQTACAVLVVLVFAMGAVAADAPWADSLALTATNKAPQEASLQHLLDSLGYSINVATDELGSAVFCGMPGTNEATMVLEVAGSAVYATSGYYEAGDTSVFYQLFGPSNVPGDSVDFDFGSIDSVGFYMKPNLPGDHYTWLTEQNLNSDNFDHAWVFATGEPHQYLICFEDLPNGGDADYQDLVIKVTFRNRRPDISFTGDNTVVLCTSDTICFDITAIDSNCQGDSIYLEMLSGEGSFAPVEGLTQIDATHCFVPTGNGLYEFTFRVEDILGSARTRTFSINVDVGSAPVVELSDTALFLCDPQEICLPLSISDADCDITSVTTTPSGYGGTVSGFDQIARLYELGATLVQIGGGAPGTILYDAGDFVGPVNSQSGVDVTLPNFTYASVVTNTGSFPVGPGLSNSSDNLLGAPTDLTFTTPGAGGPDGGLGDGSIDFSSGNYVELGFGSAITTCNGASVDAFIFTNTATSGTGLFEFKNGSSVVYSVSESVPGATAGSGNGGLTLDMPDGITFDRVEITSQTGSFEIDAVGIRTGASSTLSDICFTPDTSGVYEIIATATDACGNVGADTAYVTVTFNGAPVAQAGPDVDVFQCDPEEICLGVNFADPDNNIALTELTQGPGTLVGNQLCFTPGGAAEYTFIIHVVDDCGLQDYDTVKVTVDLNNAPVAATPADVSLFLCLSEELCHTFTATDADGGTLNWSLLAGTGSLTTAGEYCFTPTVSGSYDVVVAVTDSCGAADTVSLHYDIDLNAPPVANDLPSPQAKFLCESTEICRQFSASDADGGTRVWSMLSGDGTITPAGLWCFTPIADGDYSITAVVTDSCGAADTTSLTYQITINGAPEIALGDDSSLTLCAAEVICLDYTVTDPQGTGHLTETMISGYGAIDTAANTICFTPTVSGDYEFIVQVTDSCGAVDIDTVEVSVLFGASASITCPASPVETFLCGADSVCLMLAVSPATATVTTDLGTYANGKLCFYADTSGTYTANIIADETCGSDTCQIVFTVDIGTAPQITCPAPASLFACEAGASLCIPVGVVGADTNVTVSPIGSYAGGNICFTADTSGHYELEMIATTPCGSDTCLVIADVVINSNPVAVDPTSPVDTFLCASDQICYQFGASDIDGGTLVFSKLSGNGTMTDAGLWCFDAATGGVYTVTVAVTDSCGAADTTTLTYNVAVNASPIFSLGNDTTIFVCDGDQVCVPFALSDADNNLATLTLDAGTGVLWETSSLLCFVPGTPGDYEFIATATDSCGVAVTDTVVVTVDFNHPPVANAGADQTVFQCDLAQICLPASCSDPDANLATCELESGPAGATYDGTNICFTPTETWNYEFVLKATDACGEVDYDTVVVYYTLNSPPVVDAGADQTIFQCVAQQICWTASATDPDANLSSVSLLSGPGSYNAGSICFTPTASGQYEFVLQATDDCGETDVDTVLIDVTLNTAPVCQVPSDTTIFQCAPAQVCLPAFATDVDDNLDYCAVNVGSLSGGNWCYTPSATQTVTVTMTCIDDCGAECQSQFTVEFIINEAPTIAFGADTSIFSCGSEEYCLPFTAEDPNDGRPVTVSLVSGPGTLDLANSRVCFTPTADGSYEFVVRIEDECGEFDQDTINVSIDINEPPVADAGADISSFVCDVSQTICWPASCSDADGNLTDCLFNGPGTYNGSQICFSPATSGDYLFTLRAVDACGEFMVDSVTVTVTVNSAPLLTLQADSSVFLCDPQEVCVDYLVSDADGLGGIVETMVSGYGTIDTALNRICFTPTTAGDYDFVVSATDSCGEASTDTVTVSITFGAYAAITCPAGPIDVFLCDPDQVCQTIAVSPVDATVTTSFGTYTGGELCFDADTAGTYVIELIAASSCGTDTCEVTFNVDIGEAPQISCPAPSDVFACDPGETVCIPVGVMGAGATVSLPAFATYTGGNVCFDADTSGHYEVEVIATTGCGSDTCIVEVDVTLNSAPVVDDPVTPVDTAMCTPSQICYQFTASDIDGGALVFAKASGNGSVTNDGLWCFDATVSGTYAVTVSVTDSCGATDEAVLTYNVDLNDKPVLGLVDGITVFLCDTETVCYPYTVTDPDNNVVLEELLEGPGTLDTVANELCFPGIEGSYVYIVRITDACGLSETDTVTVEVELNHPPVANAGTGDSLFLCEPAQICRPASCSDIDDNLADCVLAAGDGTYNGSSICFTPDTSGVYSFTLIATDACGLADTSSVSFVVTMNSAPICQLPPNTTFFQCTPEEVSLPVGAVDSDGNLDHCELLSGPGSLVGGNWVYTPTADQTVAVAVMCLDDCGASCIDTFTVSFDMNDAPWVDAGDDTTVFMCAAGSICRTITAGDINNNLDSVWIASGLGTYNSGTGEYCLSVSSTTGLDKTYQTIFAGVDSCGLISVDTLKIMVDFNAPPTVTLPPDFVAFLDQVGELCFAATIDDEDDNLAGYAISPLGVYDDGSHEICFTADSTGEYQIFVAAWDFCSDTTYDTVTIQIDVDECIHVQIETADNQLQGHVSSVDVLLSGSGKELGAFEFLISYDETALSPVGAALGALPEACGWEYFQYRHGPFGNCGSGCPTGLIRIVGLAETNNGAYHPGCFLDGQVGTLATLDFLVSNDRNLECQFAPISFFWADCADNSLSSRTGDTLWVERNVYDVALSNISDHTYGFPGAFGVTDQCLVGGGEDKPKPIRCVDLTNGGVGIICADEIDDRGDLNLDGLAYTVADVVMFTNYFVHGTSAFGEGMQVEAAIAASDVNADGLPLSVADLVYLVRVVTGDEVGLPKLNPEEPIEVEFALRGASLEIVATTDRVGGIHLVVNGKTTPSLDEAVEGMDLQYEFDGEFTRILIYNITGDRYLDAGPVLHLDGANTIKSIEVGSYDGAVMAALLNTLPNRYALSQNYPNPFNPVTTIEFSLPVHSKWTLTFYNILGQQVDRYSGERDAGYHKIEWDAGRYASGVYFYRLSAGEFSATRKMVLLK